MLFAETFEVVQVTDLEMLEQQRNGFRSESLYLQQLEGTGKILCSSSSRLSKDPRLMTSQITPAIPFPIPGISVSFRLAPAAMSAMRSG